MQTKSDPDAVLENIECRTRRCRPGATSGSQLACSTNSATRPPERSTASSAWAQRGRDRWCVAHKALYGGEGTDKRPVGTGKLGWKWSIGVDRCGVPLGWSVDGENRKDDACSIPHSTRSPRRLDRQDRDDPPRTRLRPLEGPSIVDRGRTARSRHPTMPAARRSAAQVNPLGLRWIVDETNSWFQGKVWVHMPIAVEERCPLR